jgi:glucosylceramidase
VDAGARFQTIFGFGGAVTESAVHVFGQLDAGARAAQLADLYGENADGTSLRYSTGRLTMGSCDFALGYYSYNDKANDTTMANFTIAHDEAAIIPFILAAQGATAAAGRPLRFLSTPWSPPACA